MFLSTFEKPLDAKRRFIVPADYRTAEDGSSDGVFVFPSLTAGCLEAGGSKLREQYEAMADRLPFTHPTRTALQHQVFSRGKQLSFDTVGRVTLPERLCDVAGLTDQVVLVGMRDRFLIWAPAAYDRWADEQAKIAAEGVLAWAEAEHAARMGGAG